MSEIITHRSGVRFLKLHDDPPPKYIIGGPWATPKEYFDANLKCGELPDQEPLFRNVHGGTRVWVESYGCGAADWDVRKTFWYPRPGQQFELTCRACGKVQGVEVREPVTEP